MSKAVDRVVSHIGTLAATRTIVAIAGCPGSGKSTLAAAVLQALDADEAGSAALVPMDGFHFDDAVLRRQGTLDRKGAPFTYDVGGLLSLLRRLRDNAEPSIAVPVFDRALEISRAGASLVAASTTVVIVEGNYLLLDDPEWVRLQQFFDLTVMLREDRDVLEERLVARWLSYGFDAATARARVEHNDLPNVDLVLARSTAADIEIIDGRATA